LRREDPNLKSNHPKKRLEVVNPKGTLPSPHGISPAKAPCMELEHGLTASHVMRSIKGLCDPNNILNPGKLLVA
jgi:FAD/FMN-containing dehydrogenase